MRTKINSQGYFHIFYKCYFSYFATTDKQQEVDVPSLRVEVCADDKLNDDVTTNHVTSSRNGAAPTGAMSRITGVKPMRNVNNLSSASIPKYGVVVVNVEALEKEMEGLDKWGCDLFRIAELSDNRPLTCVTYTILQVDMCEISVRY